MIELPLKINLSTAFFYIYSLKNKVDAMNKNRLTHSGVVAKHKKSDLGRHRSYRDVINID